MFLLVSERGERRGPGGVLYVSGTHMAYVLPGEWEEQISSDPVFLNGMRDAQAKNKGFNFFIVQNPDGSGEMNVYMLTREEDSYRVEALREKIIEEAA